MLQARCDHVWEEATREVTVATDTDGDTHYPDITFEFCLKCSMQRNEVYEARQQSEAEIIEIIDGLREAWGISADNMLDHPGLPEWFKITLGTFCEELKTRIQK